jgi:hypothetical protein
MATSSMRWRRKFALGMGAYGVLVVAAASIVEVTDPARWVGILLAVAYALAVQARGIRRGEGIERSAYVESSSIAFVATMLSILTYGFLESWADAPKLSAFWFWFYGMALWWLVGALWKRGYR